MNHPIHQQLNVRNHRIMDYMACWRAMQAFTNERDETSVDEVWLIEHPAVFTLGQNIKQEHILQQTDIPIVPTDRGGQVTYHGPGQLMMYTLVDIRRKQLGIRAYVSALEQSVVSLLAEHRVAATTNCHAPGVYVGEKKICSIGLRIRKGCAYHGLALNLTTDLRPFSYINPCGYQGLEMTTLSRECHTDQFSGLEQRLAHYFMKHLGYTLQQWLPWEQ